MQNFFSSCFPFYFEPTRRHERLAESHDFFKGLAELLLGEIGVQITSWKGVKFF